MQWMTALGRVQPGSSLDSARTELTGLLGGYLDDVVERFPFLRDVVDPGAFAGSIQPVSDAMFGRTRPVLLALLAGVLCVLLIAAANVAGLQLMQTAERRSEMVVRMSLGASRGRLARAVFAESLVLSVLGGAAGLFVAWLAVPLLVRLSPEDVPRLQDAAIDARVFLFALLVLLATACLSALAAMLLVLRTPLETTLREGTWRVGGRSRFRSALVVSQVAAALVLLVGAGLLGRSFLELRRAPLGFAAGARAGGGRMGARGPLSRPAELARVLSGGPPSRAGAARSRLRRDRQRASPVGPGGLGLSVHRRGSSRSRSGQKPHGQPGGRQRRLLPHHGDRGEEGQGLHRPRRRGAAGGRGGERSAGGARVAGTGPHRQTPQGPPVGHALSPGLVGSGRRGRRRPLPRAPGVSPRPLHVPSPGRPPKREASWFERAPNR